MAAKRSGEGAVHHTDPPPRLVVGIGASAGGIEACKSFFEAMPAPSGIAFVVVLHLAPNRESAIEEILGRTTRMEVVQVGRPRHLAPDRVHVIAPDTVLRVRGGTLYPEKPHAAHHEWRPVDTLLSSLAGEYGDRAVGIVLSGTGADGTAGIGEIDRQGGLCVAQSPSSASYTGMPQSAIDSGAVDRVLEPSRMPDLLTPESIEGWRLAEDTARGEEQDDEDAARGDEDEPEAAPALDEQGTKTPLTLILDLLGRRYGLDLRLYKNGTLRRRTERRMVARQIEAPGEYLAYLREHPRELAALYDDLLIGVTELFRDPDVWTFVQREHLAGLAATRGSEQPLRLWVPGCATGEEAYTLAMLCFEVLGAESPRPQIYASDVKSEALAVARRGRYPADHVESAVSEERIRRFFFREGDQYEVRRDVRDCVTFAKHNILGDPPFSRMDVVSCRNLLIYLEPTAQDRVLALCHFALRPAGLLILGSSESPGRPKRFDTVSKDLHVFRAIPSADSRLPDLPRQRRSSEPVTSDLPRPLDRAGRSGEGKTGRIVEEAVLRQFTVACVAINRDLEILYFFGPTDEYLVRPRGAARMDLLSWAPRGLYPTLRRAVKRATEHGERARVTARLDRGGAMRPVECTIEPISSRRAEEGLFLVAFRDEQAPTEVEDSEDQRAVHELEDELRDTRRELQDALEELGSSTEDYHASHEELMSLNEELQSSNEELESSKEELQSVNEEVTTINRQLEEKNGELQSVNADLRNLLLGTGLPAVFLDRAFRVRRFTPAAAEVMRLVESDEGRSIEHIKKRFTDERFLDDARDVLETLVARSTEITTDEDRWFRRSMIPYRAEDDRIEGVAITFSEITAQKRAAAEAEEARLYSEAIVRTVRTPLVVLDRGLLVLSANDAFYDTFALEKREVESRELYQVGAGEWDIAPLRALLDDLLPEKREIKDYDVAQTFAHLGRRSLRLNASVMSRPNRPELILLSIEDTTERRAAERLASERADRLVQEHGRKDEFLAMLGHELRNPLSALTNGIELLDRWRDAPDLLDKVRPMMARQAQRITVMLGQLLDIARVTAGKIELARHPVPLADVIATAREAVEGHILESGQDLSVALPEGDSMTVIGDHDRLAQVFENLLMNASKYTHSGGSIRVGGRAGANTVTITVEDAGIGISSDLLPHIFDLFTQERRALDRARGGLGLGLPLVRRLVEMHDGHVDGSSEGVGHGSRFSVTLPRHRPRASREIDRSSTSGEASPSPRRILVVDDERDAADMLAATLTARGHETRTAYGAAGAFAAVRAFHPDVVLLDLGIPEVSGYDIARELRDEHGDGMFVVAVTGYQRDDARLEPAGFDAHLLKPPDVDRLSSWLVARDRDELT